MTVPDKTEWVELKLDEIVEWNRRLQMTDATYRQYPYWLESFRKCGVTPRYFILQTRDTPLVYTGFLSLGPPKARIGIVHCGLIPIADVEIDASIVKSFVQLTRSLGYFFLKITHPDQAVLDIFSSTVLTEKGSFFPGYENSRNHLIVRQMEKDAEMMSSFNESGRRKIRKGQKEDYEISVSDDTDDLRDIWPMLEKHAAQKGIQASNRPLDSWLHVIRNAREFNCFRLYKVHLNDHLVQAILILKYGTTAEYMIGGMDIDVLRTNESPAAFAHWFAMRDLYRQGCEYYDIGSPGDGVNNQTFQFKRNFRPVLFVYPEPITIILKPRLFRLWKFLIYRIFVPIRARLRSFNKSNVELGKKRTVAEVLAESK